MFRATTYPISETGKTRNSGCKPGYDERIRVVWAWDSEESAGSERGSEGGGRRHRLSEGSFGRRSERSESFGGQSQGLREDSPRIPEALGRGSFVAVSARVGNDLSGYVCDADVSGLLLDVRDPSGDPGGYEFLPWSSIERVRVELRSWE